MMPFIGDTFRCVFDHLHVLSPSVHSFRCLQFIWGSMLNARILKLSLVDISLSRSI